MLHLLLCPSRSLRLSTFFSIFYFCCSDVIISVVLCYLSLIFFSVLSILLLSPSTDILLLVVYFSSKISTLFFFITFYIFADTFYLFSNTLYVFHLFHAYFNCPLKHFYHGSFKIFDKSNISAILVLESIVFFHSDLDLPGLWYYQWFFTWNLDIFVLCYDILNIISTSVFSYFFLYGSNKRREEALTPYCQLVIEVQAPHSAFVDTRGGDGVHIIAG